MKRRTLIALLTAALALPFAVASANAVAQTWPNKPVKLINPFPAGGGTDVFARPLAAKLTNNLGQSFIVENLGGAGGTVGVAVAAKAAPDGYTFFIGAIHHTIAESLYTQAWLRAETGLCAHHRAGVCAQRAGAASEKIRSKRAGIARVPEGQSGQDQLRLGG